MEDKIVRMYQSGYSQMEIASILKTNVKNVRKVLREKEQKISHGRDERITNNIIELLKEGLTYKKICMLLDVSCNIIVEVINKNQLKKLLIVSRKDKQEEQIKELYAEGYSKAEIEERLHVWPNMVNDTLVKNGILQSNEEIEAIAKKYYADGHSFREIANHLRICFRKTKKLTRGIVPADVKAKEKLLSRTNTDIMNLYAQGKMVDEIARHLDLSPELVSHIVNKYNRKGERE